MMRTIKLLSMAHLIHSIRPPPFPSKKLCKDCKFFIANNKECALFSDANIVTGDVSYEYALSVRNDKDKCGENAKYFEENQYKVFTEPYYFFLTYWLPIYAGSLYAYLIYKINH